MPTALSHWNLNKNEIQNAVIQKLGAHPSSPAEAQFHYHSGAGVKRPYYWNGTAWVAMDGSSVPFGSPVAVTPGAANGDGSAATAARSDHVHQLDAAAPAATSVQPGNGAAVGTASSVSRSDHIHPVATAAAGAVAIGDTAAVGTASSFARSDHRHSVAAGNPVAFAIADTMSGGTATTFARSDHRHAGPGFGNVVAQTTFGATSGNGTAATVARSDHTHGTPVHDAASHSAIPLSALAAAAANLVLGGHKITGLGDPTDPQDAATKAYVDATAQGLDVKQSVRAASTANVNLSSPGATIGGVTMAAGNRVLIRVQTDPAQNGIYIWNGASAAMTRAPDFDTAAEASPGSFTFVEEGTLADTGWVMTADAPITLGTTAIAWAQFSGAGSYTAGAGLELVGTEFRVKAGNGILADGASTRVDPAVVARKFSATIGNGSDTVFVITHNLGTQDVLLGLRETSSPFDGALLTDWEPTTINTVTVRFAVAPSNNQYRATVIG